MHHTVPYGVNFRQGTDDSHLIVRKLTDNQLDCRCMIRHCRLFLHLFSAGRLMGDVAAVNADSFTESFCKHLFPFAVNQLIFQG